MPWKEHTTLLFPTLVVSSLMLSLIAVAAWSMHRQQREYSAHLSQLADHAEAAEELMRDGEKVQMILIRYMMNGKPSELDTIPELNQSAEYWINRMDELAFSKEDGALVQQLRDSHRSLESEVETLLGKSVHLEHPSKEFAERHDELQRVLNDEILKPARQYRQISRDRMQQLARDDLALTNRIGWTLLFLAIGGAGTGLLAGYLVSRGVERRFAEQERAMARSEQLATLGRLAAAVAHELRNPLTSLRIIAQAATSTGDRVMMDNSDFEILEQELTRLEDSIQTFLDYARPPRLEKSSCVLQSLLRQTVSLIERRASVIDVRICDNLPLLPILVNGDPNQLKQVFLNLMLNALDACPIGGRVTLAADIDPGNESTGSGSQDESQSVLLTFTDTGAGLPPQLGPRIFEAFVSTKETGTGLGLAICKRIVNEHGGTIEARNSPDGCGAVFSIRLPCSRSRTAGQDPRNSQQLLSVGES
ncbi:MAG: ATP-binding protein [Planctomycetaceae bacterium]